MANDLLPTGTVTFLMTDVEGSTALWEHHPGAMKEALSRHDALAHSIFSDHNGRLVKSRGEGDSLFAVFTRGQDGVAAACDLMHALIAESWPSNVSLSVRMALNTGDTDVRDGDYYGGVVNRCARVRELAHGSQILLSEATALLIRDSVPYNAELRDLGEHRLRDLARVERIYQFCHPELPTEFPPLRSLSELPNNLPRQINSFIGRENEMQAIRHLLTETALLTLTGSGGCGKTRLALHLAAQIADTFVDGVWFVELAPLIDPSQTTRTIAGALKYRPESDTSIQEGLVEHIGSRSMLVLLDNCEHLLDSCAEIVSCLLAYCRNLRVLATSREALGIGGEHVWPVMPLSTPKLMGSGMNPTVMPSSLELERYESVSLFLDRARLRSPSFKLNENNASSIAQICCQLDGMPLALELAAARVHALSVAQIADRLQDRFALLTTGNRSAAPRHQALRAAIGWSYDLLSKAEQILVRRLGVFAGGFTMEAVENICAYSVDDTESECLKQNENVLDCLLRLVDRSLVIADVNANDTIRYRLLETIRQYGQEKMREYRDFDATRTRHADWYLQFVQTAAPVLQSPNPKDALDQLETEYGNIRAALAWIIEPEPRLRFAIALHRFWHARGYVREGRSILDGCLGKAEHVTPVLRAEASNASGVLAWSMGDYQFARDRFVTSLDIYRTLNKSVEACKALNNLGIVASEQRDYDKAKECYTECLKQYRERGEDGLVATVLSNLGCIAMDQGDQKAAQTLLAESLEIHSRLGNKSKVAIVSHNLGMLSYKRQEFDVAKRRFYESVRIGSETGDQRWIARALSAVGMVESRLGRYACAIRILSASDMARRSVGAVLPPSEQADYDRDLETARNALGNDAMTLWEEGERMTMQEAAECVLNVGSPELHFVQLE